MSENAFISSSTSAPIDRKAIVAAHPRIASGARWFWWIAGLSLVNTVLMHSGSQTSFVVGLGFTVVADAFFQGLKPVAFAIDAVALGFFALMGLFALRGYRWAFLVGGLFYTLDALIYLYFRDYMPVAFHAWALFWIGTGGFALHSAIKSAESGTPVVAAPAE